MTYAHQIHVENDGHTVIFNGVCLLPPWVNAGWNPDISVLALLERPGRWFSRVVDIQPTDTGCVVIVQQPYAPGEANVPWALGGKRWDCRLTTQEQQR